MSDGVLDGNFYKIIQPINEALSYIRIEKIGI
jgi:hypothetical protein